MISTIEFRLIKVSEEKPKGVIKGWLKIDDGSIYYKHDSENEWIRAYFLEGIPHFTHLERLAPFKDKDGGDLYEGDRAICVMFRHDIQGIIEQTDHSGWVIKDELGVSHVIRNDMLPITKLGNIHEV